MSNSVISLCSWNVRGLGDNKKCSDVLSEFLSINPHIALLQESKLQTIPDNKLPSFLPRSLDQIATLPAIGSAGGSISAANSSVAQLVSHFNLSFSTTLILKTLAHDQNIAITNVYAPSCHAKKSFPRQATCH